MAEEEKGEEYVFPVEGLPEEPKEDIWYRTEMLKIIDKIIEDNETIKKFEDLPFHVAFSKSLKLTFFDDSEAASLTNLFEAAVCTFLRSLPPNKHNYEIYMKIGQLRMIFYANVKRSVGTPIQKINERIAILSQWKINTPLEIAPQEPKSIWKRLFG